MDWINKKWNYREDTIRQDNIVNNTIRCKCGHSIVFKASDEKLLCNWCGRVVKNTTQAHFIYKLKPKREYKVIKLKGDE